jgi:hypothetical protein
MRTQLGYHLTVTSAMPAIADLQATHHLSWVVAIYIRTPAVLAILQRADALPIHAAE